MGCKSLFLKQRGKGRVHYLKFFRRIFVDVEKVYTFAHANERLVIFYILFYGVMVAQQILVLFVLVRIRVEQLNPCLFY